MVESFLSDGHGKLALEVEHVKQEKRQKDITIRIYI